MQDEGTSLRTPTILIIDDEPLARTSLSGRLQRLGYRILEADDGLQGLEVASRARPDLIIVDWMMPGMDGPSLCEAVKADPALRGIQLILMTAHDQPEQIAEGLARGADDFLSKTASSHEVVARVRAGLRAHNLIHQLQEAQADVNRSYDLLQHKQEELESELSSAARFVASLLPARGEAAPRVQVAWEYLPSLALGGDLFNVTPWGAEHLGLYILDASGHGVAAALRAASLMTFLRADSLLKQVGSYDPGEIVSEVNRRFPLSADGDYFTLWVGTLHLPTWELRYCPAGHAGALLLQQEGTLTTLSHACLPVGMQPHTTYESKRTTLVAGDRLFCFSDGLYEGRAPGGSCWGQTRLEEVLLQAGSRPLEEALAQAVLHARAWQQQEQFADDAAIVGIEIAP